MERLTWTGYLWWKKQKWLPLCNFPTYEDEGYIPIEFDTYAKARDQMDHDIAELKAVRHGWKVVK